MKTRQQLIEAGKVWIIYPSVNPDYILFEGCETNVRKYGNQKFRRQLMKGEIRIAKVIFEKQGETQTK